MPQQASAVAELALPRVVGQEGSRVLREWLSDNEFDAEYEEVDAVHGGMIPLVLPDVFDLFERSRAN